MDLAANVDFDVDVRKIVKFDSQIGRRNVVFFPRGHKTFDVARTFGCRNNYFPAAGVS